MEEMYEVMRFIEHGAHCRQSMDCVRGMLMAEFLRRNPRQEKTDLFCWFRGLCVCLDQYHRSRKGRKDYRYLNPYSIVVTEENQLCLLDLEAPSNSFAVKQMQRRAVRDHFVKPVCEMGMEKEYKADLFAYGRMLQFLLAYIVVDPSLTRMEELRLAIVIGRCTGEKRGKYENIGQVMRALPSVPKEERMSGRRRKRLAVGACICVMLCFVVTVIKGGI